MKLEYLIATVIVIIFGGYVLQNFIGVPVIEMVESTAGLITGAGQ